ncbi:hypothetical protein KZZ52_31700 [Dactylosporangium sp. AC04546]|uniref:hypothetical protein n=1 Tax=Dactylosporangium sp. AC04546 TaxID=2862460 RepID=UPI002E7BE2A5|nr:hypothetical protein [Dactylosporangium sp. AC04546]WVK78556.1 hypothetical protein KZZ52_31700 [Dactylosporangium sp. AC04546]
MLLEGRYRLLRQVGEGSTAEVWSAHDELLRRRVAVRLLRPDRPGHAERFLTAGRLGARLAHPQVAAVYDVGIADVPGRGGTPYVVMEFADGPALSEPAPAGRWPAVHVGADVAVALAHAHGRWLAHGSLGPTKILLTGVGVKLIGFGTDVADDHDAPARDVRALGLLLAPAAAPGAPAELAELVRRCLHDDPARRPNAEDAAVVLDRLAASAVRPPAAVPAEPAPPPERGQPVGHRWTRRAGLVAGVVAVSLLALFAVAQAAPGALPWWDRLPQHASVPAPSEEACDAPLAQRFCAPARTPSRRPPATAPSGPRTTTRPAAPNPPPTPAPSSSPSASSVSASASVPAGSPVPSASSEPPASRSPSPSTTR